MSFEVQDFEREVLQRSRENPVLVDFWAPWCGPCKMLSPVLEALAHDADGRWELVKVNTDEHQDLASEYRISGIPAVKLFRDGRVIDEFVGFRSEAQIRTWLEPRLGAPSEPAKPDELEHAAELIDEGHLSEARTLLEELLGREPTRQAARLLLAEILLTAELPRALEILQQVPAEAEEYPHARALLTLATAAERPESSFGDDPLKSRLIEGLASIRKRDWDQALEAFVEIVERRRNYAGGLAADAGKAVFRYLGVRHPIADKYYRRFSSALNS